jgi:hypothetical protein
VRVVNNTLGGLKHQFPVLSTLRITRVVVISLYSSTRERIFFYNMAGKGHSQQHAGGISAMPSIDLDDFHRHINETEEYLQTTKSVGKSTGRNPTPPVPPGALATDPQPMLVFSRQAPQPPQTTSIPLPQYQGEPHRREDQWDGNVDVMEDDEDSLGHEPYNHSSATANNNDNESGSGIIFYASDVLPHLQHQQDAYYNNNSNISPPRSLASSIGTADSLSYSRPTHSLQERDYERLLSKKLKQQQQKQPERTFQGRPASAGAAVRSAHRLSGNNQSVDRRRSSTPQEPEARVRGSAHSRQQQAPAAPTRQSVKRSKDEIASYVSNMNAAHEKKLQQREKQKAEIEKLELVQCTFKPTISKGKPLRDRSEFIF